MIRSGHFFYDLRELLGSPKLLLVILLVYFLWRGLSENPRVIPSPLIGKASPTFKLPLLNHPHERFTQRKFLGKVSLFNVWASWCVTCLAEHGFLMKLSENPQITLYGLNYKNDPKAAKQWLQDHGNPYANIAVDREGSTAINWGVYGTPETFLIDPKGVIRYKYVGPLNESVWTSEFMPRIKAMEES